MFDNGAIMTIAHCTDSKTILSAAYDKAIKQAKASSGFEHYKDLLKSHAYEIAVKHYHKIKNTSLSDDDKDLLEKLHNIVQSYIMNLKQILFNINNSNLTEEYQSLSKQYVLSGTPNISNIANIDPSLHKFLRNSYDALQRKDDLIGEILVVHDYNGCDGYHE